MNGLRNRTMIDEFLWPELEDMDVDDVYTSGETIGLLREKFPGRVISRKGDYNWPPISYDLTPLDFFLCGYDKDKVYADVPQSMQELLEKIRAVIDEIEPQMCENVVENFIKRAWYITYECDVVTYPNHSNFQSSSYLLLLLEPTFECY